MCVPIVVQVVDLCNLCIAKDTVPTITNRDNICRESMKNIGESKFLVSQSIDQLVRPTFSIDKKDQNLIGIHC